MTTAENLSKQSIRTKKHLKQAFISLIHEKGYSHVTITDIVKKAQYNRTTFYHYYVDKIELTEELQKEMYEMIKQKTMNRYMKGQRINIEKMDAYSFELIHFIYQNKGYFNLFLINDTIPGLYQDLPNAIFEVLKDNFVFTAKDEKTINSVEHKLYMAHGTSGVIMDWIRNGYDLKPEEISIKLINILHTFASNLVIVNAGK
ncbi:TetR/AcrR family transcriptional regulator [Gracilibacillus oryzae]|uniref:TetR/AcrR family transcriptional regulator n=1 Tax=Gracilibacillus oryzae TaxID=1672701 RepID=A0A7C8GTT9_9BACI|nr:TetR/AcrR family transcriptional regulator [Gracilibacillus oryzae]KAB8137738.1 TetR/AcrR family transcriptional regulator [Gracilibacillus oryzae]